MGSADASMLRGLQRHDWHVDVVRLSAVAPCRSQSFRPFCEASLAASRRRRHNDAQIMRESVTTDRDEAIRAALLPWLHSFVPLEPDSILIEELGIEHGSSRIDVAVIGSLVYGFEIKAGLDSLARLQRQVWHYDRLVDFAYVVLTENHHASAAPSVPKHWGLIIAEARLETIEFRIERHAQRNLNRVPECLARLLWRDEALATLVSLGLDKGFRHKPARTLHSKLSEALDLDGLSSLVWEQVRNRENWGDRYKRPVPMSTLSLA